MKNKENTQGLIPVLCYKNMKNKENTQGLIPVLYYKNMKNKENTQVSYQFSAIRI